tara:strand:- start:234 stop:743 length:510 start_codon:yes stop_codon:yes gene_type:complete
MGSAIGPRAIENFFINSANGLHERINYYLQNNDIRTEGELEHILWMEIFNWLRSKDEDGYKFNYLPYRIRSQLFYKHNDTYPDLEICLGEKKLLIIELKHYYNRTFVLKDIIKDVKKNNRRYEEDESLITIVIFTSSLTHEVLDDYMEKLMEANKNPINNHIIPFNRCH